MKYTDLIENYGFARNMQETNWLKLFPHWWSENDPLLETIGKEVSFLKAQGIFTLLNTMVKPPVMIWQNSVVEKQYTISETFTNFNTIEHEAPLYKTYGSIELISYSDENIHNLKVGFTDTDYIIVKTIIKPQDKVIINVGSQEVTINGEKANIQIFGDGVSYFKAQRQEKEINKWDPQKHYFSNEILKITFDSDFTYDKINFNVNIIMDNVVFINEQNIEITGLELIPIKSVEIYAYYDFPFNKKISGWQKVSEKKYIEDTNVIYDMITTKFNTKKFYVDVWYKGLDYPYRVGFPAEKNADDGSIYHVNKELDTWGEYFGLKRRFYKENIPEEDYPYTYPPYYPYDIEQDYWYYQRLINEYVYTEWAVNDVDLVDTDGTPIVRLHSIDPFVEDLVVHAKSVYPENEKGIKTSNFIPSAVSQELLDDEDSQYRKAEYINIQNLLKYDDNKAHITLRNKIGAGITYQQYLSKVLKVFFDLKDLESDVHIEDLQILVEAEATDNKDNKYSNNDTGLIIHGISDDYVFPLKQDGIYELAEKKITYNLSLSMQDIISYIKTVDNNVVHEAIIEKFDTEKNTYAKIPFILKENDEIVHDITDVYVEFSGAKIRVGEYHYNEEESYIKVFTPNIEEFSTMSIACKIADHHSFVVSAIPLSNTEKGCKLEDTFIYTDEWHSADLRNVLQKDGISFVNVFQNDDETNTPTILIKNITFKVSYSPKQTEFDLNTQIYYKAEKPAIAQLKVEVINNGDKDLKTVVDIVSATNLSLSKTYFPVDLKMGDIHTEYIDITPEYPLVDGQYEILTVCEDKARTNNVLVSSEGLIRTTVELKDHYDVLGEPITFTAKVTNIAQQEMKDNIGKISFYIDDYFIYQGTIQNNVVTFILNPNDENYKYITPGLHVLQAQFSGTSKFKTSRAYADFSILRSDIIMDISEMPDSMVYGYPYEGIVKFYNTDGTSFVPNENESNKVSFYIDDTLLGSEIIGLDGQVRFVSDDISIEPGIYTLSVNYNGNGNYIQQHQTKEVIIIGGNTKTTVFDITAKPTDTVTLQAKIVDSLNRPVTQGTVFFDIQKNGESVLDDPIIVNVVNGFANAQYITLPLRNNQLEVVYDIVATYTDNIYKTSQGINKLTVKKGKVQVTYNNFYASQYEPLGFYFKVTDVVTGEAPEDGKVTVNIPMLGITCEGDVDPDGGVRIVYNIVNFSSKNLKDLLAFNFFLHYTPLDNLQSNQILSYTREEQSALMDFSLSQNGENLLYDYYNTTQTEMFDEDNNIIVDQLPPGFEQVYIKDGHLFARTNIDILRQYLTGRFEVDVTYTSDYLYESYNSQGVIYLQRQDNNIDLMSYDLIYNEQNESLTCYVTDYNITDDEYHPIDVGSVQFFVDGIKIGQSAVMSGTAVLPPSVLKDIDYGNHLLQAVYIPEDNSNNTYTYTTLKLRKIQSNTTAEFVTSLKGRKNKLNVTICIGNEYAMPIEGDIEVYINDIKVASDYLFGIESSSAWIEETPSLNPTINNCSELSFMIDIPEDADINNYNLTVKYLGSKYIEESEYSFTIVHEKIPTTIHAENIQIALDNMCQLSVEVISDLYDFINEGEVTLYTHRNEIVAKGKVKNNKITLSWMPEQNVASYLYILEYGNADHYANSGKEITVDVIEPLSDIYIRQHYDNDIDFDETDKTVMTDINEALQCLAADGKIHIVNEVTITDNISIQKNINIVGHNNAKIIKDIGDLLNEDNSNIKVYNSDEFDQVIYEIVGLTSNYINDRDFCIIDNELYYMSSANDLVPLFLLDDGKFYSYQLTPLSSMIQNVSINIKDADVDIYNIEFVTNDSDKLNDFVINNRGVLNVHQCVLNKYMKIVNYGNANVNCNLVYCIINNYGTLNQDNNWWGSNTISDNSIKNHIILTLWTDEDPAVIGEDINVTGQLIGANGIEYDLPPVEFFFEAEDGFFSIDTGYTIDNYIYTTYFDSTKEGKIYCTVDNETLSLDIFNYDRKTEVLLEPIDIPIGYQIMFEARVHSCADHYYDNKIVDNGYVTFYLDGYQIGRTPVQSGEAILSTYISEQTYPITDLNIIEQGMITLSATYTPNDYYFASKGDVEVQLINAQQVSYVSPNGNDNGDGTFYNPVNSIAQAIELHKQRIYLKEGNYTDNNINVIENLNIKKYSGDVIFKDHNEIIFIGNGTTNLKIDGVIFENNNQPITFNINELCINHCIFQDNDTSHLFADNNTIYIYNSVLLIVDGNVVMNNIGNNSYDINFCWYGQNVNELERNQFERVTGMAMPNRAIVMDVTTSKDILYVGSVAKIIGQLNKYVMTDSAEIYDYTGRLPTRTAFFETDIGSIMPTKDSTYNNKAIAFLNTMDENRNDDIIITFPDNTNYLYQRVKLQCYVQNIYGIDQNGMTIYFEVKNSKDQTINKTSAIVEDGCATIDMIALPSDTYTLICKNADGYQAISNFNVVTAYMKIIESSLIDDNYLYHMEVECKCVDPFGRNVSRQEVDFYIDDEYVDYGMVEDGTLYKELHYPKIKQGQHTLKITTKGYESEFEEFTYVHEFTSHKKGTYVKIHEDTLALNEPTDLFFNVFDNKDKLVESGYIDIKFDGEIVDTVELQNGIGVVDNFVCNEAGQHFLTVHYSGDNDYYNESLLNKQMNVGIEEVILSPKVTPIVAYVGSPLIFDMNVVDQSRRKINRGTLSISLNDISIGTIDVQAGEAQYSNNLPTGIQANTNYMLKVIYTDEQGRYADTTYSDIVYVNPIPTQIFMDSIYSASGKDKVVEYDGVYSSQGAVASGLLVAKLDGQEIGRSNVSTNNNSIVLHIPKLSAEETYNIDFEYINENDVYQNSNITVPLILDKEDIQITIASASYYPKQAFDFFVYCKDNNGQDLLNGKITLYIDNVLHSTQDIVNGTAIFSLKFNTIKDYQLLLVYEEDEYYNRTLKEQTFSVSNIPINSIGIDSLTAQPNTLHEIQLTFNTANGLEVTDGQIDFYFDDKKINTYGIGQREKYLQLNIPNAEAGNHTLMVKYYDSLVFGDYVQTYDFVVDYISFNIDVDPITAQLNDEVQIVSTFTNNVSLTGVLEYYLETENGMQRFIGVESINNKNTHSYAYTLPNNLSGDEKYIVVKYIGDSQHLPAEGRAAFNMSKSNIEISNVEVNNVVSYEGDIRLSFDTNVQGKHNFAISLNDIPLGMATSDNGTLSFNCQLPSDVHIGEYELYIVSPQTIMFNYFENDGINIQVIPADIFFDDIADATVKIGSTFTLPHQVKDRYGVNLTGVFKYEMDGNVNVYPNDNKIELSNINDVDINISFEPESNDFNAANDTIHIAMEKNDVIVTIDSVDAVYRGQTGIPLTITFDSLTTNSTAYPLYKIYIEDKEITKTINNTFDMPLDLPNKDQYVLRIVSDGNNIFNEFDTANNFILENRNIETITVGETDDFETATTLAKALDLVGNNGTIIITKDLQNEECYTDKAISIVGNNRTLVNCNIQNDGILTVNDLTFTDSNGSVIINNNELYIENCTFIDNNAQYGAAIYIDSKNKNTEIINCVFNHNVASLYGGAIFSNKGNDVTIQYCTFGELNCANNHGSSISINGNMYIKENIFYNNRGNDEIYVMNGTLEAEDNYFEGNITNINNLNGSVSANLNYWGYNNIDDIEQTWAGQVIVDNWLISHYEMHYTEPVLGNVQTHIQGKINQYQSRLKTEITSYKDLEGKMKLGEYYYDLNSEQITNEDVLYIGQQEFTLREEYPEAIL